jgi:hypothetical protein
MIRHDANTSCEANTCCDTNTCCDVHISPVPSVTPDQRREQILQLALSHSDGLMPYENLTLEQMLQIQQLAYYLCGLCVLCGRAEVTCNLMHAAWRLEKKYRPDSDSD